MHPKIKWKPEAKTHTTSSVAWIKWDASPRESNQPGVEKCTTGSATSLGKHSDGNHAQGDLPAGPSRVTPTKKKEKDKRQKWSREDYKEVMYAFYMSLEKPSGSHTENTFSIWRSRNHNVRMNLNGNKLADAWRNIMNNKRLTDVEPREKEKSYRIRKGW